MIDEVISPVLHNKMPVAEVERVEVPLQLFTTVTGGAGVGGLGAAVALPFELVQPFNVVATV